jgi:hypothetical protein
MGSPTVQQQWMRAIRDDRTLKAGGKAVLLVLATHMDPDGANCRPGANLLAAESGMGRDATFDNLERAKRAGLVMVLQRRGASVYVPCVGGVPLVEDGPNRRGIPDSEAPVTVGKSSTVNPAPTVGGTRTVGSSLSTILPANRRGFVDTTRADQEELASSLEPQPKDRADQALTRHGIPLTDRPSLERFLRETKKATSPGGLIVALDEQGRFPAVTAEWRTWAAVTPIPPRVNGHRPAVCSYGCVSGWLEDPDNDHRPFPCPTCQPGRRLNGLGT